MVINIQHAQKKSHNKQNSEDPVFVKNYHQGSAWLPGEVITSGPYNYRIQLRNGAVVSRHVDQIKSQAADVSTVGDIPTLALKIFNHLRTVPHQKL